MIRRLALLALLPVLAGCSSGSNSPAEPSASSIVVELEELVSAGRGCSVRTITRNLTRNSVTVRYEWRALNAAGADVGTALDFVRDVPEGGRKESTSTPFIFGSTPNCSQIAAFERVKTTVGNTF